MDGRFTVTGIGGCRGRHWGLKSDRSRSTDLFDRGAISKGLRKLYLESAEGDGHVVLVSGGVASGKTELIYHFAQYAVESGALLLTAAGSPAERTLQMGVMGQLFHSAHLPSDVYGELASWGGGDVLEAARLVHEACATLLRLARQRPVVIAVDDVHFADEASMQTLLYLQRRIRSARVLLILNERAAPSRAHSPLELELARQPYFRMIRLRLLSPEGVERLIEAELGSPVARELAAECHRLSGGNPLIVRALIDDYRTYGDERRSGEVQAVVCQAFARAVLACLQRGEPELLRAARATAVLGESATPDTIAKLLETEPSTVTALLRQLETDGLMDGGRFRHERARTAVLGDIPAEECAPLHLRAAGILHDEDAPHLETAGHLVAAGAATESWAVPILESAAKQELARGNAREAIDCLELARRGRHVDEVRAAALTAELVRAQWRLNAAAAVKELESLLEADVKGLLSVMDALLLLRALVWFGRWRDAAAVLARLDVTAGHLDAAEYRTTLEWLHCWYPQVITTASGVSAEKRSATSWTAMLTRGGSPETVDNAELVLQSCQAGDTVLEAVISAMHVLIHSGRVDRASFWCEYLLGEAALWRAATWRAVLLDVQAGIALRYADLPSAERHARAAMEILPAQGWGVAIGSPMAKLVLVNTRMGKFAEARSQLRQIPADSMRNTRFWLQVLHARGHYYLTTDRLHAALGDFQSAGMLAGNWGLDFPSVIPWRSGLAQVYVRMGKLDAARELAREELALSGADEANVKGVCLRVLAAASDVKQGLVLLRKSADLLQACGDRYELALTFAELSQARQETGEVDRARMMTRHALQLAKACQANVLYERLLPDWNVADEAEKGGLDVLSVAERRVATLASRGLTNREISRKLHVTESTVEQHLTRAYRKLNVNRRTELPVGLPRDLTDTA
ncbi:ATP-binding protein [Streptosporangium sp. NBC_01495]|uniref:ATP-binding protein n=1 Tax=Streptosporangium sp. NBC_01495 TaxID=2903899 RepID=UPI002E2F28A8|nr:AAA family ATPase [Streptosporangium sp. NBC_01495]